MITSTLTMDTKYDNNEVTRWQGDNSKSKNDTMTAVRSDDDRWPQGLGLLGQRCEEELEQGRSSEPGSGMTNSHHDSHLGKDYLPLRQRWPECLDPASALGCECQTHMVALVVSIDGCLWLSQFYHNDARCVFSLTHSNFLLNGDLGIKTSCQ